MSFLRWKTTIRKDSFPDFEFGKTRRYGGRRERFPSSASHGPGSKGQNYWVVRKDILRTIAEAYRHFDFVAESEKVNPVLRRRLKNFSFQSRDESDDPAALRDICIALHQYYGVKPIVLLDEYDTPLQEAWLAGSSQVLPESAKNPSSPISTTRWS